MKPMSWIDPNGRAFAFLPPTSRTTEGTQEASMHDRQKESELGIAIQPKGEILPPAPKAPALAPLGADAIAVPDFSGLERQIRSAAGMLDLSTPEGWLDS